MNCKPITVPATTDLFTPLEQQPLYRQVQVRVKDYILTNKLSIANPPPPEGGLPSVSASDATRYGTASWRWSWMLSIRV